MAENIAPVVAFLASEHAAVTGQVFIVCGGTVAHVRPPGRRGASLGVACGTGRGVNSTSWVIAPTYVTSSGSPLCHPHR